ncbi:MAG TPA: hypothetical protein VGG72_03610 [Bryobacteraceae bacterium]|jgi:chromate transport protein ChrA
MSYIRSLLVGFAAALLALVLLVGATIWSSMRAMLSQTSGIGAVAGGFTFNSAWISEATLFVATIVAFAIGFAWDVRRTKRKLSAR